MSEFDPNDYLTAPQVAARWGVTPRAVTRLIQLGKLPALVTPGGRYRIHRDHAELRAVAVAR